MKATRNLCVAGVLTALSGTAAAEITANGSVTNNYIWRGLTQTTNDAALDRRIVDNTVEMLSASMLTRSRFRPLSDPRDA